MSFNINGFNVQLEVHPEFKQTEFNGQKMMHPFQTQTVKGQKSWDNKMNYIADEIEGTNLSECERFDIKHDGSCGALVWNHSKNEYEPFARFDVKKKDNTFKLPECDTSRWIQCEEMPTSEEASHWPHFRPIYEDPKTYKWYINAFENSPKIKEMKPEVYGNIVTIEYMGKKFNGKPEDPIQKECGIVIHGSLRLSIPPALRNYEGFRKIFSVLPIEGLVAYPEGKPPMKIRAELFEGITWGKNTCTQQYGISNQVLL